jgi:glutathione S-transferase
VLRSTLTSPYGRKVRIAADVLGLSERLIVVPADTLDSTDSLREQNPLGKMPCLLMPDGMPVYDSAVIIEFLQEFAGSERLLPRRGAGRIAALTLATLADGITDAALLMVYERRFREPPQVSERWLAHQRDKVLRAMDAFEASPPDPARTDVVSIGLACALGYLDWREPVAWRPRYPRLSAWLARFADCEPAFGRSDGRSLAFEKDFQ